MSNSEKTCWYKTAAAAMITAVLGLFGFSPAHAEAARKPNIVFMLLDNVGWGELGSYGGGISRGAPTPQMDRLASEGLRLTNFNVETSCTPTRSDLMTGRFSVRSGNLRSGSTGLVKWEVTIAQLLKQQGYATAAFGKWHLGDEDGRYPTDFGFDEWYGIPRTSNEALDRTSPGYKTSIVAPEYILESRAGEHARQVKEYTMEARREVDNEITEKSINFISHNASAKKPFFAYIPLTQVHFPTVPSAAFAGKSGFGDFADSMMQTDYLVGKIVDAVDHLGIGKDTLIVLASDNGPEYRRPWRGTAGPWRGTYHTVLEGGLRAPLIVRWTGRIKPGVSDEMVHAVDMFNTLADVGGASIPSDRAIDGLDQLPFFTGTVSKSPRVSFPMYDEADLMGVKFRDWKYHMIWKPEAEKKGEVEQEPLLFNITVDPKEESPRKELADSWVTGEIRKVLADLKASLVKYPPIPFGAKLNYVPSAGKASPTIGQSNQTTGQ